MRIDRLLRAGHGLDPDREAVEVFTALGKLIREWQDDPERLAIAAYAYESILGYVSAAFEIWNVSDDVARERVESALYRRDRKLLRARAEGLILGLRAIAEAANAWDLHQLQVDSCVIECRVLELEDRIARLRAKDTEEVPA